MPANIDVESREAKHGEKMIELKVRFWTDELAQEKGKIRPKHAWASGVVRVKTNESHGIKDEKSFPFNSLLELGTVIERVLSENEIILHTKYTKMAKYISAE